MDAHPSCNFRTDESIPVSHAPPPTTARIEWLRRRVAMEARNRRSTMRGIRGLTPFRHAMRLLTSVEQYLPGGQRGRRNAANLVLVEATFSFPDLPPAFDGFTILHLSDLHVGNHPDTTRRAIDILAGIKVDLVVLTGDSQTAGKPTAPTVAAAIRPLLNGIHSREGALGVLGNHDGHELVSSLEAIGVRMLLNESMVIERGGQRLTFTGTDDVHNFFTPDAIQALRDSPAGFPVALVHSPELAAIAESHGFQLYLCGHTHGGQVCLPGGRPLFTACDLHRDLVAGAWRLGRMRGYTSRGVGVGRPGMRFNCRGEVAHITLRRG